jgi:hypothetical protein
LSAILGRRRRVVITDLKIMTDYHERRTLKALKRRKQRRKLLLQEFKDTFEYINAEKKDGKPGETIMQ